MKLLPVVILAAVSLTGIATSQAADVHHSLVIHATLSTAVELSNTTTSIVTVPITNASLIKPFTTGTLGLKAKDFDIVIDGSTAEIDVIKLSGTNTPTVVAVIGDPSNANTASEVHSTVAKKLAGLEVINDYAITLTGTGIGSAPAQAITGLSLKLKPKAVTDPEFSVLTATFAGGAGEHTAGAYIINGAASTTTKAYTY
jgi:hypothetical protein